MTIDTLHRHIINVDDYPNIDPDTEDGQDEIGGIAALLHYRDKTKRHFVFIRDGKEIGEAIYPPADTTLN